MEMEIVILGPDLTPTFFCLRSIELNIEFKCKNQNLKNQNVKSSACALHPEGGRFLGSRATRWPTPEFYVIASLHLNVS